MRLLRFVVVWALIGSGDGASGSPRGPTIPLSAAPAAALAAPQTAPIPVLAYGLALQQPGYDDEDVAAIAGEDRVLWRELDGVIASRRALSEDGREALKHLAQSMVLERLAKEQGIEVADAVVDARWKYLDEQVRSSGDREGIAGLMKKARLSPVEFRKFLRLSFVQEALTRRALGIGEKQEVKGEQQELWMDEAMAARGYVELPPPWKDGVVARCSDFEIGVRELVRTLRKRLPPADLKEDAYQILLLARIRSRMPDLAPEKLDRAIDDEIRRRRDDAAADPRNRGVPWERLLVAQGYVLDSIRQDPAIGIAALSRLWVDESAGPDGLKRAYEAEREHFDGLYGAAIETSVLFLRGAHFKNDLNPRTFEDIEGELSKLGKGIRSADEFHKLARERSEDAATRESGGVLGWVGAGSQRVPPEIRAEVKKALERTAPSGAGLDPSVSLVGPVRLATGSTILWLGARRPTPTWDTMAAHVHRELRKRFLDEILPRTSLVMTFEE